MFIKVHSMIEPGELVTSINEILEDCGKDIFEENVQTALRTSEKLGFLALETAKGKMIKIRVLNWEKYQGDSEGGKLDGDRGANDRRTNGDRAATPNNLKNKEEKKEAESSDDSSKPRIPKKEVLTDDERKRREGNANIQIKILRGKFSPV